MRLSEKINGLETSKFLNILKESKNTKIEDCIPEEEVEW